MSSTTMEKSLAAIQKERGLICRNIKIGGKRTSMRLPPSMWMTLEEIAEREGCSINELCTLVDKNKKPRTTRTGSVREFLVFYFRAATTPEGHKRAGHGDFNAMLRRAGFDVTELH